MPKLSHLFAIALLAASVLLAAPGYAQDVEFDRIATMQPAELSRLSEQIISTVLLDARKLQPAAQRRDCAELTRSFNSLNLAYRMLGAAAAALDGKPPRETLAARIKIVQSRVITFASRVKAEEWHSRLCQRFVAADELAADPRYDRPEAIATTDFTQAAIEARQAAEANMAAVVAAGASRKCPEVRSAMQSVQLFIPYLEKLALDLSRRPQALGPVASRRALEAARNQLVATANRMYSEVGRSCVSQPPPAADPETPPDPAPEAAPHAPQRPTAPGALA